VASKALGERGGMPPAALALAANNDFAQVMLPSVAQHGPLLRRIGKGGSLGPQRLRQPQGA